MRATSRRNASKIAKVLHDGKTFGDARAMSALPPCVDGSELARTFFTFAALVGAPMCGRLRVGKGLFHVCSIGRCAHVFGLCVRDTRPLAIMLSADQVPINSPHSTMLGGNWVVLIAGSTGSALRVWTAPS